MGRVSVTVYGLARELAREHDIRYASAQRIANVYADRLAGHPDLWDPVAQCFTAAGVEHVRRDLDRVYDVMASTCQAATTTPTQTPR